MGAPEGNRFWELRSKHGRDKIFETPKIMWDAACEYFRWCEDNPLYESIVQKRKISRDEEIIELIPNPKMRAFTIQGLCLFMGVNTMYINQFQEELKNKDDDISKDYSKIITRIRETIYNQKFTGAASGFLNPNIIARDLGLTDKKEITQNTITVEIQED